MEGRSSAPFHRWGSKGPERSSHPPNVTLIDKRAEPRSGPRISVSLLGALPKSGLLATCPDPTQQRSRETESRRAAPTLSPGAQVTAGPADTSSAWPGGSIPGSASRGGHEARARMVPPQAGPGPNDQLAPHHPHSRESGTPAEGIKQPASCRDNRHSTRPPGSPSPPPGGHPTTGDREERAGGPAAACPGESGGSGPCRMAGVGGGGGL